MLRLLSPAIVVDGGCDVGVVKITEQQHDRLVNTFFEGQNVEKQH